MTEVVIFKKAFTQSMLKNLFLKNAMLKPNTCYNPSDA